MIHGEFISGISVWPVPAVRALVFLEGFSSDWTAATFEIDTGADYTCLHPIDSARIVPLEVLFQAGSWPRCEGITGVGGGVLLYVHPGHIALLDDDTGEWVQFSMDYRIAQPRLDNVQFPSLLGRDLLQKFELVCDPSSGKVTLDLRSP